MAAPKHSGLTEHTEHLDVGDTDVFIENLQDRSEAEERGTHSVVSPETALGSIGDTLPATPSEVWPWIRSFTTRNETDDTGVVLTSTTVFTPADGGTNVTIYFSCEPE
jgi:hypothetical protein